MNNQIKDIYDGLAIILVFITILMNNIKEKASNISNMTVNKRQTDKLNSNISEITKFIVNQWGPLFIINLCLIWILTPTAYNIFRYGKVNIFNFDINQSIFMLMYCLEFYFTISYSIILTRVIRKLIECKKARYNINK